MNYWLECWKKYAVFSGRARRSEFWFFALFNALIVLAFNFVAAHSCDDGGVIVYSFGQAFQIAAFLPGLAVSVRRLHDIGKSAWWLLIALIPLIGVIILVVFDIRDSEKGENRYGPNPKGM